MFRSNELPLNKITVVAVQVATVWTNIDSPREVDAKGLSTPTDIKGWLNKLSYSEKLAFCNENRVQTQLLYGETVIITEIKEEWAHVVIPSQATHKDKRGYPGWVLCSQLTYVQKEYWNKEKCAVVVNKTAFLLSDENEKKLEISYMTTLPIDVIYDEKVKVKTPHGTAFLLKSDVEIYCSEHKLKCGTGEEIVNTGLKFVGLEYFWGGLSSYGYDCSGFTFTVHKANGYEIFRDAVDQAKAGKKIEINARQRGDLLFFAYEEGKGNIHHVGIEFGEGKMIHSPNVGKAIEVTEIKGTIYEKELCEVRRYWK